VAQRSFIGQAAQLGRASHQWIMAQEGDMAQPQAAHEQQGEYRASQWSRPVVTGELETARLLWSRGLRPTRRR
jgi:hypothetical protein